MGSRKTSQEIVVFNAGFGEGEEIATDGGTLGPDLLAH